MKKKKVTTGNFSLEKGLTGAGSDSVFRIFCFAAFFLVPFLGGNHLSLPRVTIDRFWIETSFLLLLIAAIAIGFLKGAGARPGYRTFLAYFTPFFVISCLSLVYTWNTYNTVKELNTLVWVLGAVYLWALSTDKQLPLRALVWGSVAVVICAVLQLKVLFPYLSEVFKTGWYASMLGEKPVPFVAFLNENMLGGYLLLILPISVFLAVREQKKAYLPAAAVLVLGILLSLSRLSMIVMAFELSIMCFIFIFFTKNHGFLKLIAVVAAGVFLFLILIHFHGSPSEKRVEQSFKGKTTTALTQVKTLNLRTGIWRAAKEAFQERPLEGYGAGAFEYAYRKHFGARLYTRYSHSGVAKIAVELGAFGLIASLWYFFGIIRGIRRQDLRNPFLITSILGGSLFALVDCALDTPAFVVTFFSVSSLLLAPDRQEGRHGGRVCFVPLMILLVLSFAFTGRADLAKKTVEEGLLFEEMGNPSAAASSYRQASSFMPIDHEPRIRYISLLSSFAAADRPLQDGQEISRAIDEKWNRICMRWDEDSELFFVNARANRALNRNLLAHKQIARAIELYPSSPYYVSQAAEWLVSDGDYEGASRLILRFEPFVANIRTWGNPYGLYVYRLRELSADIQFKIGNRAEAVALGKRNLDSAKKEEFVITSYKTREYVKKEWLVEHLEKKLALYSGHAAGVKPE